MTDDESTLGIERDIDKYGYAYYTAECTECGRVHEGRYKESVEKIIRWCC